MPIVVALAALIAVVWGAFWSFHALSTAFGLGVAVGAAVVAVAIVLALMAWWWRRRQEVAPNLAGGDWTHELMRDWGGVRLAAGKRLCEVGLGDERGSYIFADLTGARTQQGVTPDAWQVVLDVKDTRHPQWLLPIGNRRDAHKWGRILAKAVAQKL
jgi:hypothetical protein